MAYEFKLPDVGEGLHEAEIVRWFVKEGDSIKYDERIAEIQTDKAVVEITSPVGGKILSLAGEEGDVVKVGETFITIEQEGQRKEPPAKEKRHENEQPLDNERINKPAKKRVIAAPVVRKRARELGIDIAQVTGSEKGGRITMADLENHLNQHNHQNEKKADSKKSVSPPQHTFEEGNDERIPVKGLRKKIAEKMVKSKFTAPHVSSFSEFDVTKLVRLRKELIGQIDPGIKLTYLPFIIKAVTKALKEHPYFNAVFDDDHNEIVLKKRYNIGIATATKQGLYVPVIKHADQKSILEIAMEIEQLAQKAHEQKLELSDMQDGTFTITSTGGGSGWFATPIINYPEVAIFGAHAIKKRPVVIDDAIVIRDMMGVSLTFDHRVIDGEPAGRFMEMIEDILENPERLLLDVR
ncbi:2-oxo acid dehydrogenase subunit E2 [Pueribacillus theae]|uniref:Dihydrolipoamide acetyltransferase component of pyruvate dehydrogenase complex n=1 Tax=Pueribacillus theae TaxID=2171751 RepID=A0A2U1JVQ6_9BACI|nr:dihydrolipoamide acetyltransferase family protein [Pueribacillus theae]PWA09024.1 2-oxo acid dehydrogenase subunit E2 [Pueribacillus theae]